MKITSVTHSYASSFWEGTEKDKKAIISLPPHSFSGALSPPLSLPVFSQADDKWRKRSRAAGADGGCVWWRVGGCWGWGGPRFISAHVMVGEQRWPRALTVFRAFSCHSSLLESDVMATFFLRATRRAVILCSPSEVFFCLSCAPFPPRNWPGKCLCPYK